MKRSEFFKTAGAGLAGLAVLPYLSLAREIVPVQPDLRLIATAYPEGRSSPDTEWRDLWNKKLTEHKIRMEIREIYGVYIDGKGNHFIYQGNGMMKNLQTGKTYAE